MIKYILFGIALAAGVGSVSNASVIDTPSFKLGKTQVAVTVLEAVPVLIIPELHTRTVWVTAYTSSRDETDDTPFITASGKLVHDSVVAANFLPLGTKVQIPNLFGEKIFTVEDRMNRRKKNVVDIWMRSKRQALKFGANYTDIIILNQEQDIARR